MASGRFKELNEIARTLGMSDEDRIAWVLKEDKEERLRQEKVEREQKEELLRK